MFVSIAYASLNNRKVRNFVVIFSCVVYACFLFATVNNYIIGGNFSKIYLGVLKKEYSKSKNVYLINQPSQYKGALLFRAYGDDKRKLHYKPYTINDYMHNLYGANNTNYITVSKKEVMEGEVITNVILAPIDSIAGVFAQFSVDKQALFLIDAIADSMQYDRANSVIIGLKPPYVYIFK